MLTGREAWQTNAGRSQKRETIGRRASGEGTKDLIVLPFLISRIPGEEEPWRWFSSSAQGHRCPSFLQCFCTSQCIFMV